VNGALSATADALLAREAVRETRTHVVPPAVLCRGLRHRFGQRAAVDGIDLTVHKGEVFGLLGPNGAGKTTTIRVLNTILPLQEGTVEVFGHSVKSSPQSVRRLLGYVPQQLSVEASLTGRENVSWFARLYDVPRRERKQRVSDALDQMGLSDAADRLAVTYSGGMIRRLELAQALIGSPSLLILDEPTLGLDPVARDGVWLRVEELRKATGMAVLLTTHYMEEADLLCDRIALMHLGTIRAEGSPEDLKRTLGGEATLEDIFRHFTGSDIEGEGLSGGLRSVRSSRSVGRVS